jgi:hypothetical protein
MSLPAFRGWRLPVVLAAVYLYAFPYFPALRHANELPRILTTQQLADRGTFRLDERVADLGSLADIASTPDGHRYQNKAPGISILGVLAYYPLAAGFRLAGSEPPMTLVTWLLRALLATLPALVLAVCFLRLADRFAAGAEARGAALAALTLGSMMLPLGVLFMSHAIAAALVAAAFTVSVVAVREQSLGERRAAAIVGLLLGLAMLCEYQAVFGAPIVAAYFAWGARRRARTLLAIAVTAIPFLAALAWYHADAFGSAFRTGYAYSVDPANRVGFMGIVGFSRLSLAQLFVHPDNGLLVLSPWVVLAVPGAVRLARSAESRARVGPEALAAAAMVLVYCVFVAALHPSFGRGGWSVGPRYIAIAIPFVAWLAAAGIDVCVGRRATRIVAYTLVAIGVAIHLLATTTYPHWPVELQNPFVEITLRSLREGHAPHSLGTLAGLRGFASLAPLYAGGVFLTLTLLTPSRRYLVDASVAIILATVVVLSFDRFARTPSETAEATWRYVKSTLEP